MKKMMALACLVLVLQNLFAQKDVAEKYANIITTDLLKKHLTIIASAEMEGGKRVPLVSEKLQLTLKLSLKPSG